MTATGLTFMMFFGFASLVLHFMCDRQFTVKRPGTAF